MAARWLFPQPAAAVCEAGGHRGMFLTDDLTSQVGTMALLPQIVAAVDVPVIAAGGIADAGLGLDGFPQGGVGEGFHRGQCRRRFVDAVQIHVREAGLAQPVGRGDAAGVP